MTTLFGSPTRKNRAVVSTGLVIITTLCWAYLFLLAARMGTMGTPFSMPMTAAWTGHDIVLMSSMWMVMMAGMMLPSAVPMVSAYSTTIASGRANLHGSTPLFVAGYLVAWGAFATAGTAVQWILHDAALVDAMGASESNALGGLILIGAGLYEFTGAKDACLRQCRTPLGFLMNQWRPGSRGALAMGVHHGALCIGCCWAFMAMLFVLGVMNLWWIALVAALVLLEKVAPVPFLPRVIGSGLVLWGIGLAMGFGS